MRRKVELSRNERGGLMPDFEIHPHQVKLSTKPHETFVRAYFVCFRGSFWLRGEDNTIPRQDATGGSSALDPKALFPYAYVFERTFERLVSHCRRRF